MTTCTHFVKLLRRCVFPAAMLVACLSAIGPANAASIGVLSDGRQAGFLSLLGASSAEARVALSADGHVLVEINSLTGPVLDTVDVVWLPLLDVGETYSVQERTNLVQFLVGGGSVIWIGDADVYNGGDDSFLAAFGTSKLAGNLSATLTPAAVAANHPVLSGPHGTVSAVATNAGYGLFDDVPTAASVFVGVNESDPPQAGTFAGFMDTDSGFAGAGRAVFICDASVFGQGLDQQGVDHRVLLRNMVKWAEAAPGYTPAGTPTGTGAMPSGCGACTGVQLVFDSVTSTGETTVLPIGSGRCGFEGLGHAAVPADFLGYGFSIDTTAILPVLPDIGLFVSYDASALTGLGVDEAALRLFWYDPAAGTTVDVTTVVDINADTIAGQAAGLGVFLLGAAVVAEDCNGNGVADDCDVDPADPDGDGYVSDDCNDNGIPDACEIPTNSTAPGGPFYCEADCEPDCNNNGVPDACDVTAGTSPDCNGNATPDECEISASSTAPGGPFFCQADCDPDCNNSGVPDTCDVTAGTSPDCNGNAIPDECETGLFPEILQQPVDQVACDGETATFSVVAGGPGPISYQWRKGGVDIPGAANGAFTIDPVSAGDAGEYTVVVANGCGAVASDAATLTVNSRPTVTEQPVGQQVCEGGSAAFSVAATSTGSPSFQWRRNGQAISDGGPISGSATASLGIDPVDPTHAGSYSCTVADQCGGEASESASLVVGLFARVSEDPEDQFVCPGDAASFTAAATGTTVAYQWQFDGGGGFVDLVNGGEISGATSQTLTILGATTAASGSYQCVVASECGPPASSGTATLTVGVDTQIEDEPLDQAVCPGGSATFTVNTVGTSPNYQWEFDDGGGFQVLQDGGDIAGAQSQTLTVSNATGAHRGAYRCILLGTCGPPGASRAASLDVGAFPGVVAAPSDVRTCVDATAVFDVSASGSGLTYQWQFDPGAGFVDLSDGPEIGGAMADTLTVSHVSHGSAGEYRCVVAGDCGAPVSSAAATLEVDVVAVITTPPVDQSVCPGTSAGFSIVVEGSGATYQWQFDGGGAFEDLVDGDGISGAATDTVMIASVAGRHEGDYRCVIIGACGPATYSESGTLAAVAGGCDCNGNGVRDEDDIAAGTSQDCNGNGVPDDCDINAGTSQDCDGNGVPDVCQLGGNDCNANGVPDVCDLAGGTSQDCNTDNVPDDCQLSGNDCNANGVPDECDTPFVADAGEPVTVCTGQVSGLLGGNPVVSGSAPPYTYAWRAISGPAGGGNILNPTGERARFTATVEGIYELELVIEDSNEPPCTTTDTVLVTAISMLVDAGESFSMCAGATSAALSPSVSGGIGPFDYAWTVDANSPSASPGQLGGGGPHSENPTFTPELPGLYLLRLSVGDANDPTCTVVDELTIRVTELSIEMGADFSMCPGGESGPLGLDVTSPGAALLSYSWSIEAGSPDTDVSQFTGTGPDSSNPAFSPIGSGTYTLRVVVWDSSTPPCEQTATMWISVLALTVDAGEEQAVCVGSAGARLSPIVNGGVGGLTYAWSIESGSPSTHPGQFADTDYFDPSALFAPSTVGDYTLRLTVTDSGAPSCIASDTVVVRATAMTVDAGAGFYTRAFHPSRALGAIPVAGGGDAPLVYAWQILAGPSRDPAQVDTADAEHPVFTPAAVGTYELQVTVTDANGGGCAVSDTVSVQVIASELVMPVNAEGRAFMTLHIDEPHTLGEVRLLGGAPGGNLVGELYDAGAAAAHGGLVPTPALSRRLRAQSDLPPSSYVAVVVMGYGEAEVAGVDAASLRLVRFAEGLQFWRPVGITDAEDGPFPVRPSGSDVGRHGVDTDANHVWAVVGFLGEFAIGIPTGEAPAGAGATSGDAAAPGTVEPPVASPDGVAVPLCGAGAGLQLLVVGLVTGARRRSRARRRTRGVHGAGMLMSRTRFFPLS